MSDGEENTMTRTDLDFAQVKEARVPAYFDAYGGRVIYDQVTSSVIVTKRVVLPDNARLSPYRNDWRHFPGCDCEFCREVSDAGT